MEDTGGSIEAVGGNIEDAGHLPCPSPSLISGVWLLTPVMNRDDIDVGSDQVSVLSNAMAVKVHWFVSRKEL